MNQEPDSAKLFSIGKNIDILEINPEYKVVGLMVHVRCWEHELQSIQVQNKAMLLKQTAIAYLKAEGFIKESDSWCYSTCVMGHPPTQPPEELA